jgi:uncharacterized paraquat-inducible protein A
MTDLKENLESLGKIISKKAVVVSKKTGEMVEVVAKKAEQTVEITKIKSQISTMQRNNQRDFKDIGKIVYEKYKKGEAVDAEYIELCESISEREDSISKSKEEIAALKGLEVCPKCNFHMDEDAAYCPKCGEKVAEEKKTENEERFEEE